MTNNNNSYHAMAAFWDDSYSKEAYAYGEEPNHYLQEQLLKLKPGSILFPAEGEGRNAVFAAQLGWSVAAFDISKEGQRKAMQLAAKNKASIDYAVGDLSSLHYSPNQFDAIALIYSHFPPSLTSQYHRTFDKLLKINGVIIFEAFRKRIASAVL